MSVMNVESISISGVLGIILDKKGYSSIRNVKNRGLEKVSLIQHKMINWCIIFKCETFCQIGPKKKGSKCSSL